MEWENQIMQDGNKEGKVGVIGRSWKQQKQGQCLETFVVRKH